MKVIDTVIDDDYIKIQETDTIEILAGKIAETGIPDAVVLDEHKKVLGAIDDFDIVSKVIAKGLDAKTTLVKDAMYAPPRVKLQTELADVMKIMNELEATMIPVVNDENELLGVITIADVIPLLDLEEEEKKSLTNKFKNVFGKGIN